LAMERFQSALFGKIASGQATDEERQTYAQLFGRNNERKQRNLVTLKQPSGELDGLGQPIMMDVAYDPESGQFIQPPKQGGQGQSTAKPRPPKPAAPPGAVKQGFDEKRGVWVNVMQDGRLIPG
jgi:hypothetical protein